MVPLPTAASTTVVYASSALSVPLAHRAVRVVTSVFQEMKT